MSLSRGGANDLLGEDPCRTLFCHPHVAIDHAGLGARRQERLVAHTWYRGRYVATGIDADSGDRVSSVRRFRRIDTTDEFQEKRELFRMPNRRKGSSLEPVSFMAPFLKVSENGFPSARYPLVV